MQTKNFSCHHWVIENPISEAALQTVMAGVMEHLLKHNGFETNLDLMSLKTH